MSDDRGFYESSGYAAPADAAPDAARHTIGPRSKCPDGGTETTYPVRYYTTGVTVDELLEQKRDRDTSAPRKFSNLDILVVENVLARVRASVDSTLEKFADDPKAVAKLAEMSDAIDGFTRVVMPRLRERFDDGELEADFYAVAKRFLASIGIQL